MCDLCGSAQNTIQQATPVVESSYVQPALAHRGPAIYGNLGQPFHLFDCALPRPKAMILGLNLLNALFVMIVLAHPCEVPPTMVIFVYALENIMAVLVD